MKTAELKTKETEINPDEMMEAGLHFGHSASKTHPKMKEYIFGVRNSIHLFDTEKTAVKLKEALDFIKGLTAENKILLFVGTKIQAKDLVKDAAIETKSPFVVDRWLGGTITNFGIIKNRIEYFKDLERKKATGELEKYTKKERLKLDEEMQKLQMKFGGIKEMPRIPDAIFVVDIKEEASAVAEAKQKGIKIIGICDTPVDPTKIDYPIPANDDAISSIKYILDKVKDAILKNRPKADNKEQKTE